MARRLTSHAQAKARASTLSHWLLVSLHEIQDFACQALIRDVLRKETVRQSCHAPSFASGSPLTLAAGR
jgi:hypothetical protein